MRALIILVPVCLSLLSGCAGTTRVGTDTLAAGVGGGAANLLSKGNPIVTAAGAAGGVLLGETLNYANQNSANKARLNSIGSKSISKRPRRGRVLTKTSASSTSRSRNSASTE